MKYLEGLNEEQKKAVLHTTGPLMIVAGAGAGKTKTITHRIAHLIATGVPSDAILAVTFTNKAAGEMRERVEKLLASLVEANAPISASADRRMPFVSTFHSLGVRLLREYASLVGLPRSFVIWDRADSVRAIKKGLEEIGYEKQHEPRTVLSKISRLKGDGMLRSEFESQVKNPWERTVATVWKSYEEALRQENALDFDDLLLVTLRLLRENPSALERCRARWSHITIDEYQDTNGVQFELARLLVGDKHNICVVGDIDQCLVAGTQITMADGSHKPIEQVRKGEEVLSNFGSGRYAPAKVSAAFSRAPGNDIVRITTGNGRTLASTPHHAHFAAYRLGVTPQHYFTYLMHKEGFGWRVGVTQVHTRGQKKPVLGFVQRSNQEHADDLWVIAAHASPQEARVLEYQLSLKYGIPTIPFVARKGMSMNGYVHDQKTIDALFASLNTEAAATQLLKDRGLSRERPHHRAQSRNSCRRNITVTLCGDRRGASPMHRIAMIGNDIGGRRALEALGFSVRRAKTDSRSWRFETARADWGELCDVVARIKTAFPDAAVIENARIGGNKKNPKDGNSLPMTPAASVLPGMALCDENGYWDIVKKVERLSGQQTKVYDLNIEKTHNFIANGIVTHNSIYSWRGANIENLMSFEKTFPGAKVVLLEQNYRSTQTILTAAHDVISKNKRRFEKKLFTENTEGEPLSLYYAMSEQDEAHFVAQRASELIAGEQNTRHPTSCIKPKEIAVLYRANFQSRVIEEAFLQIGTPYRVLGTKFFDRKEIKDVLSYLRAAFNPQSRIDIARIVAVPPRGLGKATLTKMLEGAVHELPAAGQKKAKDFYALLNEIRAFGEKNKVVETIKFVMKRTGIEEDLRKGGEEGLERLENLRELVTLSVKYDEMEPPAGIEKLIEDAALLGEQDTLEDPGEKNAVSLMTVHASKGLEFDVVFVVGMEEGIFPHERHDEGTDDEEERRLFYVALTRARKRVFLSHAATRMIYGTRTIGVPSQFIADISKDLIENHRPGLLDGGFSERIIR